MDEIIMEVFPLVRSASGETYRSYVRGRMRTDSTWEGWLEFVPTVSTLAPLRTSRETTQSNRTALEYWASGLEAAYYEGALARAKPIDEVAPVPLALSVLEQTVLDLFRMEQTLRLRTQFVFTTLSTHANADIVRAFEALERQRHLVIRYTDAGEDWLQLTEVGAHAVGLTQASTALPHVVPHPPTNIPS
jgi:hypothetical protein